MALRKVTMSGRLASKETLKNERTSSVVIKGLLAVAFDVAVALGSAILVYLVFRGNFIPPRQRGFYCYQVESINNPFIRNTVSSKHLLFVTLALPFFIVMFTELIFFSGMNGNNRLKNYFYTVTHVYLEYLFSFAVDIILIEAVKCMVSRLRPHYLSVCQPQWDLLNCTNPQNYIADAHCTQKNLHKLGVSRQSFPSGHAAAATQFLTFLYFYLTGLSKSYKNKWLATFRIILLSVFGVWVVMVLISRVTDYWHFPSDVLGGLLFGFFFVYFMLRKKLTNSNYIIDCRLLERSVDN